MRTKALAITVSAAALLAGCSGDGDRVAATGSPSPSPVASPTPSPTPVVVGDPLTGLTLVRGPVVAMKIDNAVLARPYQRGMRQAALVYQELVEGGSTRFMAVFESKAATHEVGPIRSARESDLEILRGFGRPALGFSGANSGVFRLVRAAARAGRVIDASYDSVPGLYRLGERRRDARNFFAVPARLGERRGGSQPRDIGLRFGPLTGGLPTASGSASFSPQSLVRFRYRASSHTWVITQGQRAVPVAPANVIIQFVTTKPSRFRDTNGMNTPLTITTGGGRSVVLRDGRRFVGTWKRTGFGPTRYRDASGRDVLLRPGPTWIMMVPRGRSISFG